MIKRTTDNATGDIGCGTASLSTSPNCPPSVTKDLLLGDLANGLETLRVIVAHHPPLRDRFMQELESFEIKTTAAGNTVLDARATEHHADLAVAAAIELYMSNNAPQAVEVGQLAGMY